MTRPSRPPVPPVVDLQDGDAYRVLSVRQPWAWAIIPAGKDVENRPRRSHYRGPLLIHASSAAPHEDALDYLERLRSPGLDARGQERGGRRRSARPSNARPLAPPEVARVASEVAQVRSVSELDPDAIIAALRAVASMTSKRETELVTAAGRALGYRRMSSTLSDTLQAQIKVAVRRGVLVKDQGGVKFAGRTLTLPRTARSRRSDRRRHPCDGS